MSDDKPSSDGPTSPSAKQRRTLFITPMLPVLAPGDAGGKHRRAGLFLHALSRLGHRIDIIHLVPEGVLSLNSDTDRLSKSQSRFWGVDLHVTLLKRRARSRTFWTYYGAGMFSAGEQPTLYPYSGDRLAAEIGAILDTGPDLVVLDRVDSALPVLRSGRRPAALLLDLDDVYHKVLLRAAWSAPYRLGKMLIASHALALLLLESRAIGLATCSLVCSSIDQRHFARLGLGRKVRFIPNALRVPRKPPGLVKDPTVLYLGSFHHPPNAVAAERLVRRIWPLVRNRVPEARLLIAGSESDCLPSRAAGFAGVEHLGFVGDLDALYARTRLVCCPITTGSGTRLKLIEAAAFRRPMLSTRIGAEGLDFRDGYEIVLRESDQDLADACVSLLLDDALCERLGDAGHSAMLERYDQGIVERQIERLIEETLQA